MNKNIHYKPKYLGNKSKNAKTRKSIWRAFKKKIRQLLKKTIYEEMEE